MYRLKILACLLETRPISQKGLLDTCPWQFYGLLTHLIVYVLFVVNQTFEITCIVIFVLYVHICLPTIRQVAVIMSQLSGLLFQTSLER